MKGVDSSNSGLYSMSTVRHAAEKPYISVEHIQSSLLLQSLLTEIINRGLICGITLVDCCLDIDKFSAKNTSQSAGKLPSRQDISSL